MNAEAHAQARLDKQRRRDRSASVIASCALVSVLMYNGHILWTHCSLEWRQGAASSMCASGAASVCLVVLHLCLEASYGAMCACSARYRQHRDTLLMVTRTGLFLFQAAYIPVTFAHTLAYELTVTGRASAVTWRLLTSFAAIHLIEVLSFRLPVRVAAPYHVARLLLGALTWPQALRALTSSAATSHVACSAWLRLAGTFTSLAAHVLGSAPGVHDSGGADGLAHVSPLSCGGLSTQAQAGSVLALMVWLQASLGIFVPLYLLALLEDREQQAYAHQQAYALLAAAGSQSGSASSSSSSGSSSMSGAAERGSSSGGPASAQPAGSSRGSNAAGQASTSAQAQGAAASSSGSRDWTDNRPSAAAAGAAAAARGRGGGADSAGSNAAGGSLPLWPRHFGAVMHASLMVAGTGVIWVAVTVWLHQCLQSASCSSWLLAMTH